MFGTLQTSTSNALPGFGQTATSTASSFGGFGFNKPATPAAPNTGSLFGVAPPPVTSLSAGLNLFPGTLGRFGAPATTTTTSSTTGFGGLNFNMGGPQQPQTQQVAKVGTSGETFIASLSQPLAFGDERDVVLAKWNQLQASWGTGTGYCSKGLFNYTQENIFARFKSVAYNLLPTSCDTDGLVVLTINRPSKEITTHAQQVQDILFRVIGSKPNLQLSLEDIRPAGPADSRTEITIKVVERLPTGGTRNIAASELTGFLQGATIKTQLESQLSMLNVQPQKAPTPGQLSQYLERAPPGINQLLWQQGGIDNPDPRRFIPVPLVGLKELRDRMVAMEQQAERQTCTLQRESSKITQLKTSQINMESRIAQARRTEVQLSHRILKILCRQEVHRKQGYSLSAEEETLRYTLERLWTELVAPCGVKGRVREALSSLRVGDQSAGRALIGRDGEAGTRYALDPDTCTEIKEHLKQRQQCILDMIQMIKEDSASLDIIRKGGPISRTVNASRLP